MDKVYTLILLYAAVILTACDANSIDDDSELGEPSINTLELTDSYSQTVNYPGDVAAINATISAGEFDVVLSAEDGTFYVNFMLNDQSISDGGISFYNDNCGSGTCSISITCRFTTEVKMSCGNIGEDYPGNPETDVSSMVTALPMDAYIVVQVCNAAHTNCTYKYQTIQLQ